MHLFRLWMRSYWGAHVAAAELAWCRSCRSYSGPGCFAPTTNKTGGAPAKSQIWMDCSYRTGRETLLLQVSYNFCCFESYSGLGLVLWSIYALHAYGWNSFTARYAFGAFRMKIFCQIWLCLEEFYSRKWKVLLRSWCQGQKLNFIERKYWVDV